MHQIRVHLSKGLDCQIIGDYKYGNGLPYGYDNIFELNEEGRANLMLHSKLISLPYFNENKERIFISSSLPKYYEKNLKQLGFDLNLLESKTLDFVKSSFNENIKK
jgi:hypothetical protein